jgi:hypothetical protein
LPSLPHEALSLEKMGRRRPAEAAATAAAADTAATASSSSPDGVAALSFVDNPASPCGRGGGLPAGAPLARPRAKGALKGMKVGGAWDPGPEDEGLEPARRLEKEGVAIRPIRHNRAEERDPTRMLSKS